MTIPLRFRSALLHSLLFAGLFLSASPTLADQTTPFAKMLCLKSTGGDCVISVGGATSPALPASFIVPRLLASGQAIKQLVIDFVSGDCVGTGRTTEIFILAAPDGPPQVSRRGDNFSSNRIPMWVAQFNDTLNTNAVQSFALRTQMVYVPDTTISIAFDIAKAGGFVCKAQLNGYFVSEAGTQ